MADPIELRWLHDARAERESAGAARTGAERLGGDRHAVVNALTAVAAAAGLLDERWDDLTEVQRRDLVATLRARVDQLRALLSDA